MKQGATHQGAKMSNYRRAFLNGGTFFFTVVSYMRYPIFKEESAVRLLRDSFKNTMKIHPFRIDAIVIMPDHLHTIWTLPDDESDFSIRWKQIKGIFSRHYSGNKTENITASMISKNEKGIWQRRFWEHVIRNQEDFNKHCDYIHYNPVKHGLANSPREWKYSSFRQFVERGLYSEDWGSEVAKDMVEIDLE
ncbi:MAG: transposase [Dehalococcoidales bacterium]|nr:transposase [Dehalococcoidales bacterium]